MKINLDRLCKLAGVDNGSNGSLISEGSDYGMHEYSEGESPEGIEEEDQEAEEVDEMDEMIEIDEVMLVQELRRAKRIMQENRKRSKIRQKRIVENELKQIIESEVSSIMKELNLNSGWLYGKRRPTRSRKGHVHQGSYLKGIGFE